MRGDLRATIEERLGGEYTVQRELGPGGMGVVYSMGFVDGESFADRIQTPGRVPVGEVVRVLREAAPRRHRIPHQGAIRFR